MSTTKSLVIMNIKYPIIKEIGNDKIMIFVEKKIDADRLRFYLCQKGKIKSILFFFCEILILNK